jgi:hypothetical protein
MIVWMALALFAGAIPSHAATDTPETPNTGLACPPDFLTDIEQRMFTKEGQIRSGPWHVHCYQNGAAIFDRDHLYAFCQKGQSHASLEGADGHAIKFQFPPEVACVWER